MLNEKLLEEILGISLPALKVNDIHWRTQDSDINSILFYKVQQDETSQDKFIERIQSSKFAWLILNIDHPLKPSNCFIISEKNWPRIQKKLLDEIYPVPPIKLIAITGTNGKTTTADLVLQLGEMCGKKGLSIGTLGVRENQKTILDFGLTSPSFIDLRKFLFKYGHDKDFCVMEVSSHALVQKRIYGLKFDMGGWLSFSQDHLDFHKTMENYFEAKMLLFSHLKSSGTIFVPHEQEDLYSRIHKINPIVRKAKVLSQKLPLFFTTSFNRQNLEVAVEIVEQTFNLKISENFSYLIPPDGRFFIREYKNNFIIVDFAHTPDALENILKGIKEAFSGYRLKVLFGCGGDRDRAKRPQMGRLSELYADEIYLTSDNPRMEDPEQIISEILSGIDNHQKVKKIVQRPEAVKKAFSELKENEILLLAGKGHEDYILFRGVKYPYSDIVEVEKFLSKENSNG
jgi:UDP-N-acetylmuramoyl-L-alanyl-D-glutamate--2,6-diaminopimelate ligase